ncbi:MAG: phosphomannomutase/phosphoglucomutase [bacterium]
MKIEKTLFRRYDIRGKYPTELNEAAAYTIALAFSNIFLDVKTVLIGGDIRESTPTLKDAFIKGLIDGGKEVIDAGIVITPVVYFGVCHFGYDAGIVITGSHLEKSYNGIKIVFQNAEPSTPKDYDTILEHILSDKLQKAKGGGSVHTIDIEKEYFNYIKDKISLKKPLKIIIDTGNGTARLLPEKIFKAFHCDVETIFADPDDSAPNHIPDPYKHEYMQDLKKKVIESDADLGIGFDGDGDRAGFVDKSGYILTGDDLLMIFSRDALQKKKGPIVVDSRASMSLIEEVKKQEQDIILTVGYHAAVLSEVIKKNAVFGGETTSHFYFPLDFYLTDDAIFAALKLSEIVSEQSDFVTFVKELPRHVTSEEIFIEFLDTEKYNAVDTFTQMVKAEGFDVNDVDGARVNFEKGWGIVRPSNTSPFIKVKFEGVTKKDLSDVSRTMISLMERVGIEMSMQDKKKLEMLV